MGPALAARGGWGRSSVTEFQLTGEPETGGAPLPKFLYSPAKAGEESGIIHNYLDELDALLAAPAPIDKEGDFRELRTLVREYREGFDGIDVMLTTLTAELRRLKLSHGDHAEFFPLIEAAFYERPFQAAEFL